MGRPFLFASSRNLSNKLLELLPLSGIIKPYYIIAVTIGPETSL